MTGTIEFPINEIISLVHFVSALLSSWGGKILVSRAQVEVSSKTPRFERGNIFSYFWDICKKNRETLQIIS